ncbi:galactose-binding domain-like protein [Dactylonectria estremocensis]|uniref:Galactose-binding domain-like protein n=1 Tax=Dactylonectria estremocensis TaxID=1079267 RepID=A0A9P9EM94_9HYPO|nr:galactose-binding domain-like protein [Dactylonectria estremocensis]
MAQTRGIVSALIDRSLGWLYGLPPERCGYSAEAVTIPLKDGTILAADIYKPIGIDPLGTILVQCPYGRGLFPSLGNARIFTPRGYQVLLVSCRGTFGSTGDFNGGVSQPQDGQEVVAWMRLQPWYTGKFATIGASYLSYAQWALLRDPPQDQIAAVMSVSAHDFGISSWGSGSFSLLSRLAWTNLIVHQESVGLLGRIRIMKNTDVAPLMDSLPLQERIDAYFGTKAPWLSHALSHPDITDPSWSQLRQTEALEKVNIPILLTSTWQDVFLDQTMQQYQRLRERGCNVALTIAPGTHMDSQSAKALGESFLWLEKYLAGKEEVERKHPVQIYVGGPVPRWLELPSWPPATISSEFYLDSSNTLVGAQPSEESSSSFTFDPAAPTPTLGGPLMSAGGVVEDSALGTRDDTLVFTTEPLKEPLEILGRPVVKLEHSTDLPYADIFVRLSQVDANGKSYNVTERFIRLPEKRDSRTVEVQMRHAAYQFPAGTRLRLLIAGGSHPQFVRNLGSAEPVATGTTLYSVKHTVHHGGQSVSSLVLPVSSLSAVGMQEE